MNLVLIKNYLSQHRLPTYRLDQLLLAVKTGATTWPDIGGWPKPLLEELSSQSPFVTFKDSKTLISSDGTVKATLTLKDDQVIETVLMSPKPGLLSVCVSCEVGCAMNCAFCATGNSGFRRILTAEEITDQWLFWLNYNRHQEVKPSHLVFMGMGEPFHNPDQVFTALKIFHEDYGLGWRKMSLSTCGLIPGISVLAHLFPQVNLAISLHAPNDTLRTSLMPINQVYPLIQLSSAITDYLKQTGRQVMFEYLLLQGVNDSQVEQLQLIKFCRQFPPHLVHVNLIRYNPTGLFTSPSEKQVQDWKRRLSSAGLSVSIRKNLGVDILGACGQLAAFH